MISLSFDIDWANDMVIQHSLDILESAKIKATFFVTHDSPVVRSIESYGHEIGLHPNFLPNFNGDGIPYRQVIDSLMQTFPTAQGIRAHSLCTSAPLLDYCYGKGLKYDSSLYFPNQTKPYKEYTGIYRIPFINSDFQTVIDQKSFENDILNYDSTLPYVFVFHPIHIYLNTMTKDHYEQAKKYNNDIENLLNYRNHTNPGAENFLKNLLVNYPSSQFRTMFNIYDHFKVGD